MIRLKFFREWNSFTEKDIIKCIENGKLIKVELIQGETKRPKEPLRPLSIDGEDILVDFDNRLSVVKLKDVKKINI